VIYAIPPACRYPNRDCLRLGEQIAMETAASSTMTLSERADALEKQLSDELDRFVPVRSPLYTSGDRDPRLRWK